MKVTVIGSSSFLPTLLNSWSSFLIDFGKDDRVLLDTGSWKLLYTKLPVQASKFILITHRHPDHLVFIGGLLRRMQRKKRRTPLTILCPTNVFNHLHSYSRLFNPNGIPDFATLKTFKPSKPVRVAHLMASETEIWAAAACHTTMAAGYAFIQGDTKVVIAPDTAANCSTLIDLAKNATAFFHDCTFPTRKLAYARRKGHSSPEGAGYDAQQANVKTLILIHVSRPRSPRNDGIISGARHYFDGNILVASDNSTYTF